MGDPGQKRGGSKALQLMGITLTAATGPLLAMGGGARLGASMPGTGGKQGSEGFY